MVNGVNVTAGLAVGSDEGLGVGLGLGDAGRGGIKLLDLIMINLLLLGCINLRLSEYLRTLNR